MAEWRIQRGRAPGLMFSGQPAYYSALGFMIDGVSVRLSIWTNCL